MEWVKGTWLDEVKRSFFFETGVSVRVATIKAEVEKAIKAGTVIKTDGYTKDRGQLLALEYVKEKDHQFDLVTEARITWASSIMVAAFDAGLKFPVSVLWDGGKNASEEFKKAAETNYTRFQNDEFRHGLAKKYYYNFLKNKEIMSVLSPAVLATKEPKQFNYLPNVHLGASTQVMVYNISLLKAIGIEPKNRFIPMKEFLSYAEKVHAFNKDKSEAEKTVFFRDYDGFLARV